MVSKAKQQQAFGNLSSSRQAANRTAKSLVTNARIASRQGTAGTAPAKKPLLSSIAPGPAPQQATGNDKASGSPASPAAAAAALEQASALGKLGCPKCRYAKYGCRKCRAAFVRNTGISIPVDRKLHMAAFALLQTPSESIQQPAVSSQAGNSQLTKSSQPAAAGKSTAGASVKLSSLEPVQQPVAKKQKTASAARAAAKHAQQASDERQGQHALAAKQNPQQVSVAQQGQSTAGKGVLSKAAKSGPPSASAPASSSAQVSAQAVSAMKSKAAAAAGSSDPPGDAAKLKKGTKRAVSAKSPAPAAKRSRLFQTVTAADLASASHTARTNPSRASQPGMAVAAAASKPIKLRLSNASQHSAVAAVAVKPHTVRSSEASKQAAGSAAAATAQRSKGSGSIISWSSRSQPAPRKPVRLALAKQTSASKQRATAKSSTAAGLSAVKPGTAAAAVASGAPKSASGKPVSNQAVAKGSARAVSKQPAAKGPALPVPEQAAGMVSTVAASKKATGKSPAPALPKQAAASANGPQSHAAPKPAPLPRQPSKPASVPSKAKIRSVAAPKAMTAAKIQRTASGKAATAAGHAVAEALDSKLGCSKCRFVPSGCKKCRAKQAGQLSLAAT